MKAPNPLVVRRYSGMRVSHRTYLHYTKASDLGLYSSLRQPRPPSFAGLVIAKSSFASLRCKLPNILRIAPFCPPGSTIQNIWKYRHDVLLEFSQIDILCILAFSFGLCHLRICTIGFMQWPICPEALCIASQSEFTPTTSLHREFSTGIAGSSFFSVDCWALIWVVRIAK